MTETENQNVQKPEEMNNQNNNIKNEIRQRNAVLINQQTKRQIRTQAWKCQHTVIVII